MKRYKRSSMKHTLAALVFCLTLGMGILCHAEEKGTVTVPSAKIRASADTASEQLGSVELGGTVDIISETVGSDGNVWYQVYVDANTKGYIRGDLVQKGSGTDSGASTTTTSTTTTQDLPETVVTPTEARKAAVKSDTVAVRKGAGTSYAKVGTAKRGTVVTVTGEATASDGAKWYQVSIMHQNVENIGFIRADLLTFDDIPADVATSNIVGEGSGETGENPEGQPQEGEAQPEEQPQPEEAPQPDSSTAIQSFTPMDGGSLSYVMPGFEAASMSPYDGSEEKYEAYINGAFIIMYGRMQSGEEGWFLYDKDQNVYQRYVYTAENTSAEGGMLSGSLLPMIALVIIIVILLAIIGLLFLKLREYRDDYEEDEDDYSEEDDIEDLEEDDYGDELPARPPVRRPQRPQQQPSNERSAGGQSVRRPQQRPSNGQAPNGQSARPQQGGQPVRRPQQPSNGQSARPQQGGQSQRPPQRSQQPAGQSQGGEASARRSGPVNGQPGNPTGGQNRQRPNNRPQGQSQGAKAKPILDSEKEDMEFIDI